MTFLQKTAFQHCLTHSHSLKICMPYCIVFSNLSLRSNMEWLDALHIVFDSVGDRKSNIIRITIIALLEGQSVVMQ